MRTCLKCIKITSSYYLPSEGQADMTQELKEKSLAIAANSAFAGLVASTPSNSLTRLVLTTRLCNDNNRFCKPQALGHQPYNWDKHLGEPLESPLESEGPNSVLRSGSGHSFKLHFNLLPASFCRQMAVPRVQRMLNNTEPEK